MLNCSLTSIEPDALATFPLIFLFVSVTQVLMRD